MKRLIASSLATLIAAAALAGPAVAQAERRTELIALNGQSVDRMQLRHDFHAVWVVDNRTLLYRDATRDYYLVALKEACEPLDIRSLSFSFHPGDRWQLRASHAYEIRPEAGAYCDVARIEQIDDARAKPLRDTSDRRVW